MTSLILAMLTARRAQTLVVVLLAVLATAGAVAGPAYQRTAEDAVIDAEVAMSTPLERSVQVTSGLYNWPPEEFANRVEEQLVVPGFTIVYAAGYDAVARFEDRVAVPRFTYRDDVCAHVLIRAGRCPAGAREVLLGRRTADRLGVDVGAEVPFTSAKYVPNVGWMAGETWTHLTIVGTYDPADSRDPYWAGRSYFGGSDRAAPEPAFVTEPTLYLVEHSIVTYTADLIAGPEVFSRERIPALRADLDQLRLRTAPSRAEIVTDIPDLVDRIDGSRTLVGRVVPIAAVPLVLLCLFVVYLTVAHSAEQRQGEFGLFALRGLPLGQRWALTLGPTVVPVLIGAPIGYLLGHYAVSAFASATLPVAGAVPVGTAYVGYAALAVVGALLAGAWAQRQLFRSSPSPMVRRVPPRARPAGSLTALLVTGALAVVAAIQLRWSGGSLTGVVQFGPGLVALAVALAVAHLLGPASHRAGLRALRRGRLGPALAALRIARWPGTRRLSVFVTVAVALLGFAVIAASVAADRRAERANAELGANRVLPVAPVSASALLAATRTADPDGRFAMAVVTTLRPGDPSALPVLAVDSGRLSTVAAWPDGTTIDAAEVARRLRPPTSEPVIVTGTDVRVDVTMTFLSGRLTAVPLRAHLAPDGGRPEIQVELGEARPGRATYTGQAPGCAAGCRLASIEARQPGQADFMTRLVLHRISQNDRELVSGEQLGGWRPTVQSEMQDRLTVSSTAEGLAVDIVAGTLGRLDARIRPPDIPYPLPVVGTLASHDLSGLDGNREPVTTVGVSPRLPRVGSFGMMVDLETLDRVAGAVAVVATAEVWLGPEAPADAADRLRAAGLVVGTERRLDELQTTLSHQGPAVALRFLVATGVLALLLATGAVLLVAAIDRSDRTAEIVSLRTQGLRRRDAAVYARRGHLWVVAVAVAAGTFAAVTAWVAVGPFLPQFTDRVPDGRLYWPQPVALLAMVAVSAIVLTAPALMAAGAARSAPRSRPEPTHDGRHRGPASPVPRRRTTTPRNRDCETKPSCRES